MNEDEMMDLIARFRKAFRAADREGFMACVTEDFEWHQHFAVEPQDLPGGRVIVGVDGMVAEIEWRQANWTNTSVTGLVERRAGDVILQTFTTKGTDENGKDFHYNVVDLYPVREGRIFKKDTYWKQQKSD